MNTRPLTETVTVQRPLDRRLADLVYFVRYCQRQNVANAKDDAMGDQQLVAAANAFWDQQHGED